MPGVIERTNVIEGAAQPLMLGSVPTNGTDAVQTLTFGGTPTGGTFTLSFGGYTTAPIAWSATNATLVANIDAALEALPSIGVGNMTTAVGTMTAGIGTITLTFAANLGRTLVGLVAVVTNAMTGTAPTLAVANTTPGVNATFKNAPIGLILQGGSDGIAYVNSSTTLGTPTWVHVGAQS